MLLLSLWINIKLVLTCSTRMKMGWSDPFDSFSRAVITERLLRNPKRGCPLLVIRKFFVDEDLNKYNHFQTQSTSFLLITWSSKLGERLVCGSGDENAISTTGLKADHAWCRNKLQRENLSRSPGFLYDFDSNWCKLITMNTCSAKKKILRRVIASINSR